MPRRLKEYSKQIRNIEFDQDRLDAKMEQHAEDCITQIKQL